MNGLTVLMRRELALSWGRGGGPMLAVTFYAAMATLLPLATGPAPSQLAVVAPGSAWLALALASLLSLERLFERDYEDGALDLLALGPAPLELVAFAKCLAQWITTAAPLALAAPIVAVALVAPTSLMPLNVVTALIGGLGFGFCGGIGRGAQPGQPARRVAGSQVVRAAAVRAAGDLWRRRDRRFRRRAGLEDAAPVPVGLQPAVHRAWAFRHGGRLPQCAILEAACSPLSSITQPTTLHGLFALGRADRIGAIAAVLAIVGLWLDFAAPPDYQQGYTVHVMFIHVPASMMSLFVYACLGVASFLSLVFRQALADAAARAAAPIGAGLTLLALITGSLWGKPMWGTWWVWDARLTSELVLLLFYLGYMALQAAIDDEARGFARLRHSRPGRGGEPRRSWSSRSTGGIPCIRRKLRPCSRPEWSALAPVYVPPFLIMIVAYLGAFGALWLVRIRSEVWRRRANVLAVRAAR